MTSEEIINQLVRIKQVIRRGRSHIAQALLTGIINELTSKENDESLLDITTPDAPGAAEDT